MFNAIKTQNASTSYIYAPRFMSQVMRQQYWTYPVQTLNAIMDYYRDVLTFENRWHRKTEAANFLVNSREILEPLARKKQEDFKTYLEANL